MAKSIHKGTELNNVNETWQQNERARESGADMGSTDDTGVGEELRRVIQEEAAEYDNENKADRVLPGDRASVRDDGDDTEK